MKTKIVRQVDGQYKPLQEVGPRTFMPIEDDISLIVKEIEKSSITPSIFQEREYESGWDDLFYEEHYVGGITRFAINDRSLAIEEAFDGQATVGTDGAHPSLPSETNNDSIFPLTNIEKQLIDKAGKLLLTSDTRAAVVDIFVRYQRSDHPEHRGKIIVDDHNIPETHSVVIYKNPSTLIAPLELVVIDPSNFTFSSHLGVHKVVLEGDLAAEYAIKTFHHTTKIYTAPLNSTGQELNQYRDCTDVAIKISKGLTQAIEAIRFNTSTDATFRSSIKDCATIKYISNVRAIDEDVFWAGKSVRIKQSSDSDLREQFSKINHVVNIQHKLVEVFASPESMAGIKQESASSCDAIEAFYYRGKHLNDIYIKPGIDGLNLDLELCYVPLAGLDLEDGGVL